MRLPLIESALYSIEDLSKIARIEDLSGRKKRTKRNSWSNASVGLLFAGGRYLFHTSAENDFFDDTLYHTYQNFIENVDEPLDFSSNKLGYFESLLFLSLMHCNKDNSHLYTQLKRSFSLDFPKVRDRFLDNKKNWLKTVYNFFEDAGLDKYLDDHAKNNEMVILGLKKVLYCFAMPEIIQTENILTKIDMINKNLHQLKLRTDEWIKKIELKDPPLEKGTRMTLGNIIFSENDITDVLYLLKNIETDCFSNSINDFYSAFDEDISVFQKLNMTS